jgi:hypothetical protein
MVIRPISAGAVSGADTISLDQNVFGGFVLSTDGTNAGTVTIRDTDGSGTILAQVTSVQSLAFIQPIRADSGTVHYTISGTGASAMLYEWVQ